MLVEKHGHTDALSRQSVSVSVVEWESVPPARLFKYSGGACQCGKMPDKVNPTLNVSGSGWLQTPSS